MKIFYQISIFLMISCFFPVILLSQYADLDTLNQAINFYFLNKVGAGYATNFDQNSFFKISVVLSTGESEKGTDLQFRQTSSYNFEWRNTSWNNSYKHFETECSLLYGYSVVRTETLIPTFYLGTVLQYAHEVDTGFRLPYLREDKQITYRIGGIAVVELEVKIDRKIGVIVDYSYSYTRWKTISTYEERQDGVLYYSHHYQDEGYSSRFNSLKLGIAYHF